MNRFAATIALSFVFVTLAGCQGRKAQQAVAALLRDPDSAKFRSVSVTATGTCGEVNGKNAYGAYSGFQRFAYLNDIRKAFLDPQIATTDEDMNNAARVCFVDKTAASFDPSYSHAIVEDDCNKADLLTQERQVELNWQRIRRSACP